MERGLEGKQAFHANGMRRATHFWPAIGSRPNRMVYVREEDMDEFWEAWQSFVVEGGDRVPLCEQVSLPLFRWFLDVDVTFPGAEALSGDKVGRMVEAFLEGEHNVFVCAAPDGDGYSVRVPSLEVDLETALDLRERFAQFAASVDPEGIGWGYGEWNRVLDVFAIETNQSMRVVGSVKAVKGVDVGRVYRCVYSPPGWEGGGGVDLLKMLSIRVPHCAAVGE